uniref:Sepiapterin reductase n=1 Tax=Callorhinchus milii TaxID=7868 RepID=A0A4W3IQ72_CALMI
MAERETVFRECLCVITGASRGLGKELALQLAPSLTGASSLVLVARSGERLEEVRRAVLASQPSLRVLLVPADLSTGQGVGAALAALPQHRPRRLLLLNNAGSLGDVSKFVVDFTSPAEITDYFSLNVTSFMCLSAGVLRAFPQKAGLTRTVVNISSLCAIKPFKSWSLYCMGKAAREMMCHVLAAEQPDLRVLSYAPGNSPHITIGRGVRVSTELQWGSEHQHKHDWERAGNGIRGKSSSGGVNFPIVWCVVP